MTVGDPDIRPVLDRLLSAFQWPGAQHPWVQPCSLTLSQTLACGPGTDPLRCPKAVVSPALYSSGCLVSLALTLLGGGSWARAFPLRACTFLSLLQPGDTVTWSSGRATLLFMLSCHDAQGCPQLHCCRVEFLSAWCCFYVCTGPSSSQSSCFWLCFLSCEGHCKSGLSLDLLSASSGGVTEGRPGIESSPDTELPSSCPRP